MWKQFEVSVPGLCTSVHVWSWWTENTQVSWFFFQKEIWIESFRPFRPPRRSCGRWGLFVIITICPFVCLLAISHRVFRAEFLETWWSTWAFAKENSITFSSKSDSVSLKHQTHPWPWWRVSLNTVVCQLHISRSSGGVEIISLCWSWSRTFYSVIQFQTALDLGFYYVKVVWLLKVGQMTAHFRL